MMETDYTREYRTRCLKTALCFNVERNHQIRLKSDEKALDLS